MEALIAVPAMEMMHSLTAHSMLTLRLPIPSTFSFVIRASVDKARNMLAWEALDRGVERILWLDSDMIFPPDTMERLNADLDDGWDIVTGLYFTRKPPIRPLISKSLDIRKEAVSYLDYPKDTVFPVAACGFGCVMMKTDVLRQIQEPPFDLFPGVGEDYSFCHRANQVGAKMACDSRVKSGHIGMMVFGEQAYRHPG